jgi:hypothetical protein
LDWSELRSADGDKSFRHRLSLRLVDRCCVDFAIRGMWGATNASAIAVAERVGLRRSRHSTAEISRSCAPLTVTPSS